MCLKQERPEMDDSERRTSYFKGKIRQLKKTTLRIICGKKDPNNSKVKERGTLVFN